MPTVKMPLCYSWMIVGAKTEDDKVMVMASPNVRVRETVFESGGWDENSIQLKASLMSPHIVVGDTFEDALSDLFSKWAPSSKSQEHPGISGLSPELTRARIESNG